MPKHHHRGGFLGFALVLIGLLFLLSSLDLWRFHWSQFLIIIGLFFCAAAFTSHDRGPIFPGSIILLIGLFFLLRHNDLLNDPMFYMWPIFLLIIGAAFLLLYIFRPNDWGLIIPGGALILIGLLFLAYNYDVCGIDPARLIGDYWPLILILVGVKMVLDSRRRKRQTEQSRDKSSAITIEAEEEEQPSGKQQNDSA